MRFCVQLRGAAHIYAFRKKVRLRLNFSDGAVHADVVIREAVILVQGLVLAATIVSEDIVTSNQGHSSDAFLLVYCIKHVKRLVFIECISI